MSLQHEASTCITSWGRVVIDHPAYSYPSPGRHAAKFLPLKRIPEAHHRVVKRRCRQTVIAAGANWDVLTGNSPEQITKEHLLETGFTHGEFGFKATQKKNEGFT